MSDTKTYSTSELAQVVGVPRTTINDWLSRYEPFIESTMRGKRRVYLESVVTVLKEISELRTAGKSAFEIEQALTAGRTAANPAGSAPAMTAEASAQTAPATPAARQKPLLPRIPIMPDFDEEGGEKTAIISERTLVRSVVSEKQPDLQPLIERLDALQIRASANTRHFSWSKVMLMVGIVIIVVLGVACLIIAKVGALQRENQQLVGQVEKLATDNKKIVETLSFNVKTLDAKLAETGESLSELQKRDDAAVKTKAKLESLDKDEPNLVSDTPENAEMVKEGTTK